MTADYKADFLNKLEIFEHLSAEAARLAELANNDSKSAMIATRNSSNASGISYEGTTKEELTPGTALTGWLNWNKHSTQGAADSAASAVRSATKAFEAAKAATEASIMVEEAARIWDESINS
jgi:hypothetical protein